VGCFDRYLFTVTEATMISGLAQTTLYEAINPGDLKTTKISGRQRILRRDLEDFLKVELPFPTRRVG